MKVERHAKPLVGGRPRPPQRTEASEPRGSRGRSPSNESPPYLNPKLSIASGCLRYATALN